MSSRTGKQSPFPALQEGGLDFKVLALSILPGATQKVKWLLQTSLGFERRSPVLLALKALVFGMHGIPDGTSLAEEHWTHGG